MPIVVTCPQCGTTLHAPDGTAGRQVQCGACQTLLNVPAQAAQAPAAPAPAQPAPPPPMPAGGQQYKLCPFCAEQILAAASKCRHCGEFLGGGPVAPAGMAGGTGAPGRAAPHSHSFNSFPVWAVILLHFPTIGIFTTIWLNLLHGQMPTVRPDDPSAGKAIGFLFIPFFNLYWVFFTYHRLCVRINEQCAAARLPGSVPTGLAIAMCVILVIPYVGLLSFFFIAPIFAGIVQAQVNALNRAAQTARRA